VKPLRARIGAEVAARPRARATVAPASLDQHLGRVREHAAQRADQRGETARFAAADH
jgi:hypothetical protein